MYSDTEKLITSPVAMSTNMYYPQETSRYAMFRHIAGKYAYTGTSGLVKNCFDRKKYLFALDNNPDSIYGSPRHAHGIKDEENIPILAGVLSQDKFYVQKIVSVAVATADAILESKEDRPSGYIGNPLFAAHFLTVCAFIADNQIGEYLLKGALRTGSRTVLPATYVANLFRILHFKKPLKLDKIKKSGSQIEKRLSKSTWRKTAPRKAFARACWKHFIKGEQYGFNQFKKVFVEQYEEREKVPNEKWADKAHSEHLERLATCGIESLYDFIKSHVKLFFRIKEANVRIALVAHHVFLAFLFYHPTAYLLELLFWAKAYSPTVKEKEPTYDEAQEETHQRWINSATLYKELHKEKIDWKKINTIGDIDILCDQTFPEKVTMKNYAILKRLFTESPHFNDPERKTRINYFLSKE